MQGQHETAKAAFEELLRRVPDDDIKKRLLDIEKL